MTSPARTAGPLPDTSKVKDWVDERLSQPKRNVVAETQHLEGYICFLQGELNRLGKAQELEAAPLSAEPSKREYGDTLDVPDQGPRMVDAGTQTSLDVQRSSRRESEDPQETSAANTELREHRLHTIIKAEEWKENLPPVEQMLSPDMAEQADKQIFTILRDCFIEGIVGSYFLEPRKELSRPKQLDHAFYVGSKEAARRLRAMYQRDKEAVTNAITGCIRRATLGAYERFTLPQHSGFLTQDRIEGLIGNMVIEMSEDSPEPPGSSGSDQS